MTLNFEECYGGTEPVVYGRDLVKRIGIKGHYINEHDVADFLGYDISIISWREVKEFETLTGISVGEFLDTTCSILDRNENKIFLSPSVSKRRQRFSLFHEFGHDIIPYHAVNTVSICGKKNIDAIRYKKIEKEAFLAGAEIMFPLEYFVDDSMSMELKLNSIRLLSDRYNGSFEATAIRYAMTNQNVIAIVAVNTNDLLTLNNPQLKAQYCARSPYFSKFIRSGTELHEEYASLIYECWDSQRSNVGEIPAYAFGSFERFTYLAECMFYYDRVFVLLHLPSKQIEFYQGALIS